MKHGKEALFKLTIYLNEVRGHSSRSDMCDLNSNEEVETSRESTKLLECRV